MGTFYSNICVCCVTGIDHEYTVSQGRKERIMMAGMKSGIKSSIIFGLILSLGLTLSGGMQVKAADDKKADKKATNERCV